MAKKIPKRRASTTGLFIKLLIPWIVMGAVAYLTFSAGLSDLVVFGSALGGALAVTVLIHLIDKAGGWPRRIRL